MYNHAYYTYILRAVELLSFSAGQLHTEEAGGGQDKVSCSLRNSRTLWSGVLRCETSVDTGIRALLLCAGVGFGGRCMVWCSLGGLSIDCKCKTKISALGVALQVN